MACGSRKLAKQFSEIRHTNTLDGFNELHIQANDRQRKWRDMIIRSNQPKVI